MELHKTQYLYLMYVWGHSYEFADKDNWQVMEDFCAMMGGQDDIWYATNIEIVDYMEAAGRLQFTAAGDRVYNPSACSIWVEVDHRKVEVPGGVDTQMEWLGQNRTLSARYILEGVDKAGQSCRIFVENNGIVEKGGELSTTPRILTDSEALSYLEQEELFGTITPTQKGVTIHIFC